MSKPSDDEIQTLGRYFAVQTNNQFWDLSEQALDEAGKQTVLKMAFASLYHWEQVGTDENKYLAYLSVARALAINDSFLAKQYAVLAFEFFKDTDQLWIKAFCHAILSHALSIHQEPEEALQHYQQALDVQGQLDEQDLAIFNASFQHMPNLIEAMIVPPAF